MNSKEIAEYLSTTPLSEIPAADLLAAEETLDNSRITLSESDLTNPVKVQQYLDETAQLIAINMEQANIDGLIEDVLSLGDSEEDSDFLTNLVEDSDRLANIEEASSYAVDAFLVDPESLTSTELVIGSVGLVGNILQDEDRLTDLSEAADLETATLITAGFTADEIDDIQTASEMLELAKSGLGDDMASLFEGLPF